MRVSASEGIMDRLKDFSAPKNGDLLEMVDENVKISYLIYTSCVSLTCLIRFCYYQLLLERVEG